MRTRGLAQLALLSIMLACLLPSALAAAAEERPPPYFIHISDLHIGWAPYSARMLKRMVETANSLAELPAKPLFVLVTGDLTEHGEVKEYEELVSILSGCKVTLLVIPGNHETYAHDVPEGAERGKILRERYLKYCGRWCFNTYNYVYDVDRLVRIIAVDCQDWNHVHTSVLGVFTEDLLKFIESKLEEARREGFKYVFVAAHQPPRILTTHDDVAVGAEALVELLTCYNAVYICGHVHLNEVFRYKGATCLIVNSLGKGTSGNPKSPSYYRVVVLGEHGLASNVIPLTNPLPAVVIYEPSILDPSVPLKLESLGKLRLRVLVLGKVVTKVECLLKPKDLRVELRRLGPCVYGGEVDLTAYSEELAKKGGVKIELTVSAISDEGVGSETITIIVGSEEAIAKKPLLTPGVIAALVILIIVIVLGLLMMRRRREAA